MRYQHAARMWVFLINHLGYSHVQQYKQGYPSANTHVDFSWVVTRLCINLRVSLAVNSTQFYQFQSTAIIGLFHLTPCTLHRLLSPPLLLWLQHVPRYPGLNQVAEYGWPITVGTTLMVISLHLHMVVFYSLRGQIGGFTNHAQRWIREWSTRTNAPVPTGKIAKERFIMAVGCSIMFSSQRDSLTWLF